MARKPRTPKDGNTVSEHVTTVPLDETTRQRYLNYALSVITSRALPDVRDGLKPVQRRILFSMFHNHRLVPERPPIKSAKVVGSVIGEWHPHGDSAVYDAMARMAQWWSLRAPLVDGHGNFGSLDGDPPAAYRYTEAKLTPIAIELLSELNKDTVNFQANYDGKDEEPLVLPSRFPNLLVNGSTGIAVGMATNIPPHNLSEVIEGAIALIDDRNLSVSDLMKSIKGPDFPTGGEILNNRTELREIYETGQGSIRLRGEYTVQEKANGQAEILLTSIPFAVDKSTILERIGELIVTRKVPQLVDVRDESTTDVRIVLEVQKGADPQLAMAYLFKNTPLQNNFSVNLTCLIPTTGTTTTRPQCLNLKDFLEQFIDFRFETVKRRFSYDLRILEQRIHILAGFKTIFDALDQVLKIIRQSEGKADSAEKLKRRFNLDDIQTNAILETPIYKLSRTEIKKMLNELADKKKQAKDLQTLLASKTKLWNEVKKELEEVSSTYGDKRRSKIGRRQTEELEFDPEAYIVKEDAVITISTDGWIRRVGMVKDLSKARLREGDALLAALIGSTVDTIVCFSNFGSAYTLRIGDIPPARSGYGDPAQKLFKFKDGERIIAALSLDPRFYIIPQELKKKKAPVLPLFDGAATGPDEPVSLGQVIGVSSTGMGVRFDLAPFKEPSTRLGRKFMKVREREEVVHVEAISLTSKTPILSVVSQKGRVLLCKAEEVGVLSGPGRGVTVMKLDSSDRLLASRLLYEKDDQLIALKQEGAKLPISIRKYQPVGRGGKGHALFKRGSLKGVQTLPVELPVLDSENGKNGK
ncbi:DNA topoisomerase IV subunit A [Candidatus Nitronereus thalassa]|uniref:DNA topoisomerase (ATP-hydrolyzing) n=1 Tax=Candidatus Nitronereus thalassa TaxID=3020898 RepID=A0ABU3K6T4_9BACT|nr:DNA topoisomerase IV subunit A [Candidatus Nitronereus thalassa]MDT7042149.1 DNA topoisomerase IV subunit A [Candidatus Nitronereus thalassa]